VGGRAGGAEKVLRKSGFKHILHLQGDLEAWRQRDLPLEKPSE
jgi:rhodanese-related sulfurtransferase